jgi:hypothetical protein
MKRWFVLLMLLWLASGLALAQQQDYSEVEFLGFYQRVQGFDFFSGQDVGGPLFSVADRGFSGGGMGFTFNVNHWLGIWQQVGFFTGVKQSGLQLRMINEVQGVKLTRRNPAGIPVAVYTKAGIGFVRHVFSMEGAGDLAVRYSTSLAYGGGAEIPFREGMSIVLDLSRLTMGLPQISADPARDKWDSNYLITTGVVFRF